MHQLSPSTPDPSTSALFLLSFAGQAGSDGTYRRRCPVFRTVPSQSITVAVSAIIGGAALNASLINALLSSPCARAGAVKMAMQLATAQHPIAERCTRLDPFSSLEELMSPSFSQCGRVSIAIWTRPWGHAHANAVEWDTTLCCAVCGFRARSTAHQR